MPEQKVIVAQDNSLELQGVLSQLKEILAHDLDVNLRVEDIGDTVSLLEQGLALDSVVIVELITILEDRFGFQFTDDSLQSELFENLTTLGNFILSQKSGT